MAEHDTSPSSSEPERHERSAPADDKKSGDDKKSDSGKKSGGDTKSGGDKSTSTLTTVIVAFVANVAVALAKTVAAVITGSASMTAEAFHSWADSGNEVFLLIAERRSVKKPDRDHPFGYGRTAYVWSMIAAFGLFTIGAAASISNGINQLGSNDKDSNYGVAYIVLAVSAVLEGTSFLQSVRTARRKSERVGIGSIRYILRTSQTTLRAVFFEDSTALVGLAIAAGGLALHEITGDAVYDAIGSILVGVLLGVVALFLIYRNAQFLIGQPASPELRKRVLAELRGHRMVKRVTLLHLEYVGPGELLVIAAIDLDGDAPEHEVAERLQRIEDDMRDRDGVGHCVLSLSSSSDPDIDTVE